MCYQKQDPKILALRWKILRIFLQCTRLISFSWFDLQSCPIKKWLRFRIIIISDKHHYFQTSTNNYAQYMQAVISLAGFLVSLHVCSSQVSNPVAKFRYSIDNSYNCYNLNIIMHIAIHVLIRQVIMGHCDSINTASESACDNHVTCEMYTLFCVLRCIIIHVHFTTLHYYVASIAKIVKNRQVIKMW